MNQVQYSRISSESDEDDERVTVQFRHSHCHQKRTRTPRPVQKSSHAPADSPWTCECISRLLVLFILFLIAMGFGIARFPIHKFHHHGHLPHSHEHPIYLHAAVAAGQKECSDVGKTILQEGGNAVDAGIATLLCQGVVEPEYCGIGGGFIMNIFNKSSGRFAVIDARETAPLGSSKNMFSKMSAKEVVKGPLSIAVPGTLRGFSMAYKKYGGGVSWKRLFRAAISKSQDGFFVNQELANRLKQQKYSIVRSKHLCEVYCDGSLKDVKSRGDKVVNRKLAATLTQVSEEGVGVFYNGAMATAMASEIQQSKGIITLRDFENYEAVEREIMTIPLPNAGLTLAVPPLPSGGPVLAVILGVLDSYNISSDLFKRTANLQWHRTVEAFKHAYGARTHFGDPAFLSNGSRIADELTSAETIKRIRSRIVDDKTFADPEYYGAAYLPVRAQQTSTSHVSVLAPNGDAVAVTSTINWFFGSLYASESTGVLFNDEMSDFFLPGLDGEMANEEQHPNRVEPEKRPLSSMAPCILFDAKTNDTVYIFGAAGGTHIPTSIALALLRLLYFGVEEFDDAIEERRIHHQLIPNTIVYERNFDKSVLEALRKLGHEVVPSKSPTMSHVNGIKNHVSHIHAHSDERNIGSGTAGW